jgi:proteasome accessory factor A
MARPLLFGIETEWFNAHFHDPDPSEPERIAGAVIEVLKRRRPYLSDGRSGVYLNDGGKFYPDCGHGEQASAECTDPESLVAAVKAFERLLRELAPEAERELGGGGRLCFGRLNVDYLSNATYGQHESYLTTHPPAYFEEALVPHLATRAIYCGEGGLGPFGVGLAVSPRLLTFCQVADSTSTSDRPIFNLRNEPLAAPGYFRLHVTAGSTLGSELALYLKVGFTALVVRTAELLGPEMAHRLQLANPVAALHQVASDLTCRLPLELADGRSTTAVEIQREYLYIVRRYLRELPAWAPAVCDRLETVLNALAGDPSTLRNSLDWAIKHHICAGQLRRNPGPDQGTDLLAALYTDLGQTSYGDARPPLELSLGPSSPALATVARLNADLVRRGLRWSDLTWDDAARMRLAEIDLRFGLLGEGLFDQLDAQGLLAHRVLDESQIERAACGPPAGSRAELRGAAVTRLSGQDEVVATWHAVFDERNGRVLDLTDPFQSRELWITPEEFHARPTAEPAEGEALAVEILGNSLDPDIAAFLAEDLRMNTGQSGGEL